MVTLVHHRFGSVWHDEVGHIQHGKDLKGQSEMTGLLLKTMSDPSAPAAHDCSDFIIRVITDDGLVKDKTAKTTAHTYQMEFRLCALLPQKDGIGYHAGHRGSN